MVKVGDKIKIILMVGEPQYSGKEGVVEHVDDIGLIHGSWVDALLFLVLTYLR